MKFLIVANGPFVARDIISELAIGRKVVALDGAANKLAKIGILPHVILGDFDSATEDQEQYWGITQTFNEMQEDYPKPYDGKYGCKIVPAKDQFYTDLIKAINFCDQEGAKSIDIVCATGGRMDHSLGNMRALRVKYKEDRPLFIHTESQTMYFVKNSKAKIHGKFGDYCGVLAFPAATFSSDEELRWNVTDFPLIFGMQDSTCNMLGNSKITLGKNETPPPVTTEITVTGEALIVSPGVLQSQQELAKLSYVEQLKMLYHQEDFVLLETTIGHLIQVREVRQEIKKQLNIENPNKKDTVLPSMHYVSHSKPLIFCARPDSFDTKVLVAMTPRRQQAFNIFINRNLDQVRKLEKSELQSLVKDLYPERIKYKL